MASSGYSAQMKADLESVLSKEASISLPIDSDSFKLATKRWSDYARPGIAIAVVPANEDDIVATIVYARSSNTQLFLRSTGHGFPAALEGNVKNAILLILDQFKKLEYDSEKATIVAGPGVVLKEAVDLAWSHGKELTIGSCDTVGLIGLALGGGLGRLQGMHGLLSDHILSARMVLASGDIVTVSSKENRDLYWALKGAGHNFGLVLDATFQLYDLVPEIYNANRIYSEEVLEQLVDAMNTLNPPPKEISMYLAYAWFPDAGKVVLFVDYAYVGSEAEGKARFEQAFGHIPSTTAWDAVRPWNVLNATAAAGLSAGLCADGGRKNAHSCLLKTYVPSAMRKLYEDFVEFQNKSPQFQRSAFAFESYPQEAVRAVPPGESAVPFRDANILVLCMPWYDDPGLDDLASEFGRNCRAYLHQHNGFEDGKPRGYVNYARGDESFEEIYGHEEWRLDRLKALKRKYDPCNVFSSFHPIPV